jgi:hypothetical protein
VGGGGGGGELMGVDKCWLILIILNDLISV